MQRWLATAALVTLFMLRIFTAQAYYIVCYALGIYLLNLFLAFLQPKFDPSLELDIAESEVEEGAPGLPTSMGAYFDITSANPTSLILCGIPGRDGKEDEFKPFIRRLPEFKFWHSATRAVAVSLLCAFIPIFDVPVLCATLSSPGSLPNKLMASPKQLANLTDVLVR